jgi:hypothetical protein
MLYYDFSLLFIAVGGLPVMTNNTEASMITTAIICCQLSDSPKTKTPIISAVTGSNTPKWSKQTFPLKSEYLW